MMLRIGSDTSLNAPNYNSELYLEGSKISQAEHRMLFLYIYYKTIRWEDTGNGLAEIEPNTAQASDDRFRELGFIELLPGIRDRLHRITTAGECIYRDSTINSRAIMNEYGLSSHSLDVINDIAKETRNLESINLKDYIDKLRYKYNCHAHNKVIIDEQQIKDEVFDFLTDDNVHLVESLNRHDPVNKYFLSLTRAGRRLKYIGFVELYWNEVLKQRQSPLTFGMASRIVSKEQPPIVTITNNITNNINKSTVGNLAQCNSTGNDNSSNNNEALSDNSILAESKNESKKPWLLEKFSWLATIASFFSR